MKFFNSLKRKLLLIILMFFIPFVALMQFYFFPTVEDKIVNDKKDALKITTQLVFSLIHHLEKKVEAGTMTREAAQAQAREEIKNLRYNKSEYFWIHGLDLKMIMHPIKAELDGTDIS